MLTKEELLLLLSVAETASVERTITTTNVDKLGEAICAFANDMPNSGKVGYLLIGVYDDGCRCGLKATDELMQKIAAIRSDGNVLPIPVMTVYPIAFEDGDVIVVEVEPAKFPPVRYRGRTWIRVGPRRAIATIEEESMLIERRAANFPTFDCSPCQLATLDDLDVELFKTRYLPLAIAADVLAEDKRPVEKQLEALSFYSTRYNCPTYGGIILFGKDPARFLFGDYIQFVQFAGKDKASDIVNQQEFGGNLMTMLPRIEVFIETAVAKKRPVPVSLLREELVYEYPKWPIRELVMNAVMHRDYKGNAPSRFYQYGDRLEISNPGGLYGKANAENFPEVSDYRNPVIAQAMFVMGFVNKFGRGISRVQRDLLKNGNGKAVFSVDLVTVFVAKVAKSTDERLLWYQTTSLARIALIAALINENEEVKNRYLAIFDIISRNPSVTIVALIEPIRCSQRTISSCVERMKEIGILRRVGGTRGHWEIVAPQSNS